MQNVGVAIAISDNNVVEENGIDPCRHLYVITKLAILVQVFKVIEAIVILA